MALQHVISDRPDIQTNFDDLVKAVAAKLAIGATAGGDLTGTYPDPQIAADAVGAAEIAAGAVGASELADGIVLELAVNGTMRKVAFGSNTVVFSAADTSAQLTVAHGLGVAPLSVICMPRSPANARVTIQETASPDTTNFYVKGFQTQGSSITANQNFYWVAIG